MRHFIDEPGKPSEHYLQSVRARFGQWILDTCNRDYDQDWLNYQHEISIRHAPGYKGRTDSVANTTPYVEIRYIIGLIYYPITATIKPFLARKGHSETDVERMHQAWFKSVVMQVALWTEPHIRKDRFDHPEMKASI